MATSTEVVAAASVCAEVYGVKLSPALLALWERLLGGLPRDVLTAAVDRVLRSGRDRMPPPGLVIHHAKHLLRAQAEEVLGEIRSKATREGLNGREVDSDRLQQFPPEVVEAAAASGLLWARSFTPTRGDGSPPLETQAAEFIDAYVAGFVGDRSRLPKGRIVALLDERATFERKRLRA